METNNMGKYLALMKEVKQRTYATAAVGRQEFSTSDAATNLEFIYLQFRKILELIAFGSLVANEEVYTRQYRDFASAWNAKRLLRDLRGVNSDFYPKPIVQVPSTKPGIKMEWKDLEQESCLNEDEFITLYNECSGIVHARNPNGSPIDYRYYETNAPQWQEKIMRLLSSHLIRLTDDSIIYLIQMGGPGQEPTYTPFMRKPFGTV